MPKTVAEAVIVEPTEAERREILAPSGNLPVNYDEMESVEHSGFNADEVAVPRIRVAQDLSPQTKKQRSEYIAGLEAGDVFNTVTEQIYRGDPRLVIVVAHYHTTYVEWTLRKLGGGLVADRTEESGIEALWLNMSRDEDGRRKPSPTSELIRSGDYYILAIDPQTWNVEEAVLTLSGTQSRKAKQFNTVIAGRMLRRGDGRTFRPLACAFAYTLNTVPENNDKGDWHGVKIGKFAPEGNELGEVMRLKDGPEIYKRAVTFREMVISGRRRAAVEGAEGETTTGGRQSGDDDIPF